MEQATQNHSCRAGSSVIGARAIKSQCGSGRGGWPHQVLCRGGVIGNISVSKTDVPRSLLGPYANYGLVAEWLRSGLQNRVRVFNSLSDLHYALIAQLDRASDYESEGWGFEYL